MKKLLLPLLLALVFTACNDKNPDPDPTISQNGLYVLNEGIRFMNNSEVSFYDFETGTVSHNVFMAQNNRALGDIGNDIGQYGSKIYILTGFSSQIEVTDLQLKSIRQIPLVTSDNQKREPHSLLFHGGKVYITCFDGTVCKLDTASLLVEGFVQVGKNPEGLCISNNKLYVSNSGGLDFTHYDSTVSVIDLASFLEIKKIVVGTNPFSIATDEAGNVFVGCRGNYTTIGYSFLRIDPRTDQVAKNYTDLKPFNFTIRGRKVYLYDHDFGTGQNIFTLFNLDSESVEKNSFVNRPSLITAPYGMTINPATGAFYLSDAIDYYSSGKVVGFNSQGDSIFSFATTINPKKIMILEN